MSGEKRGPPTTSSGRGEAPVNAEESSRAFDRCASRCVTTWLTSTASARSETARVTKSGMDT